MPRKRKVMEVTPEQREREREMLERQAQQAAGTYVEPEPIGPVISPTPRPIQKRSDPASETFQRYDEGMRQQGAVLYRRIKDDGKAVMEPWMPEVVTWLRTKGVRIRTQMTPEGSFYVLEPRPED